MTDQFIDYVNSDQDVQYADTILIRDISAGTINENTVNQVLAKMGLSCKVFNNKNALGMYLFGELFWQDQPKTSADRFEDSRPSAMNHGFSEPEVRAESAPIEEYVESTNQIGFRAIRSYRAKESLSKLICGSNFAEQSELLKFLINDDKEPSI